MVKSKFINLIEKKSPSSSRKDVEQAIHAILEQMTETLESGGRIEIRGFGSFQLSLLKPRTCRNPKTGKKVTTSPKKVVRFRSSKELSKRVNNAMDKPIRD